MGARISTAMKNQLAQTAAGNFSSATLKIYTGSQPATPNDTATGTLLMTFTGLVYQYAVVDGVVSLDTGMSGTPLVNAVADGTAGWGRLEQPTSGFIMDGTVGTTGANFIINTTSIVTGNLVSLLSCDIVMPGA